MKCIHVLMIVENLPVPFDRRVWQEALTLMKSGYDVTIVCPKGKSFDNDYEIINGVSIYRYQLPTQGQTTMGYVIEYAYALIAWLRLSMKIYSRKPFQVIHAANPPDLIFLIAGLFKLMHGTKFIFDHHDLCPELYLAKYGQKNYLYQLMILLERATMKLSDVVISTNESFKEIALSRGGKDPSRVVVVRSGVDIAKFGVSDRANPKRQGDYIIVGYLGIIGKQDGVDVLIEIASYIVNKLKRRDIKFIIIGDGPEQAAVIDLTTKYRLSNYVSFLGALHGDRLLDNLHSFDICVACDPLNEMNNKSTMNKTMEYMALGKPMVHFDLVEGRITAQGASLYAIPNDVNDFAENILKLADSQSLRNELGRIGRERTEKELQWLRVESNLIDAYRLLGI